MVCAPRNEQAVCSRNLILSSATEGTRMCTIPVAGILLGLSLFASPSKDEHREEAFPSESQVIQYLEGKRVTVATDPPGPKGRKGGLLIPKGGVVAIEIGASGKPGTDQPGRAKYPWETDVLFIVKKDGKRYAVEGKVKHLRVGADRAFYGLTVWSITEQ